MKREKPQYWIMEGKWTSDPDWHFLAYSQERLTFEEMCKTLMDTKRVDKAKLRVRPKSVKNAEND